MRINVYQNDPFKIKDSTMHMLYIELPQHVVNFATDAEGMQYIEYENQHYYLNEIATQATKNTFVDSRNNLVLTVTTQCPNEDKLYLEFLPHGDKPSQHCKVYNGKEKNNEIQRLLQAHRSWIQTDFFKNLPTGRQQVVMDRRAEVKNDRYTKGPTSV